MLMSGVVVHHHMQLAAWVGLGDELEEGQELAMAVARLAGVGDPAGDHLQGGEQGRGAVPEVVVGAPLDLTPRHRPEWLGACQRLDLGLLVHANHDRVGRRVQVQPDHVADPGLQLRIGGELEGLGLPGLEVVLGPDSCHRAVADAQLSGQQPRGPVSDAKRLGRRREGDGQDLGAPVTPSCLGTAGAGSIGQLAGQPLAHIAAAPGDHRRASDTESLSDLGVLETPSAANNSSLARRTSAAGAWAALDQRRKTASSAGGMTRAAAEDGIVACSPPIDPAVKSP
jgi:hypothetical protein